MRFLTTSMMALMVAIAITGCSGGSSNSSDNSATSAAADNSAASSSSDNSATSSSDNSGAMSTAPGGEMPSYPGAKTEAAGSNSMGGAGAASGKVLSTADSFDKVYAWYQKNMPAGSEKSHMDAPVKSAVFMVGDPGKDQQSVTITTANGKTMITIAHVKM